ncbi:MAG: hypothetical protein ACRDTN_15170 [Mycobacterium sp.]
MPAGDPTTSAELLDEVVAFLHDLSVRLRKLAYTGSGDQEAPLLKVSDDVKGRADMLRSGTYARTSSF